MPDDVITKELFEKYMRKPNVYKKPQLPDCEKCHDRMADYNYFGSWLCLDCIDMELKNAIKAVYGNEKNTKR